MRTIIMASAAFAVISGCAEKPADSQSFRATETAIIACEAAHVTLLASVAERVEEENIISVSKTDSQCQPLVSRGENDGNTRN